MDEHDWRGERLVEMVREHLVHPSFDHRHVVQEVALVDEDVRVVLRHLRDDDRPHAVRYSLERLPVGACTGEVCDTPDQRAIEVVRNRDEAIGTREIEAGDRRVEPDGVVLVRWLNTDSWTRGPSRRRSGTGASGAAVAGGDTRLKGGFHRPARRADLGRMLSVVAA